MIKHRITYNLIFFALFLKACTCDCFDEPDKAYGFTLNFKSFSPGISLQEFIEAKDSAGNPRHYKIYIQNTDSSSYMERFEWNGVNDSIVHFRKWDPPSKVNIEIDLINVHHKFSEFEVEGYEKGTFCRCFTPTKRTMRMDDSITIDMLKSGSFVIRK